MGFSTVVFIINTVQILFLHRCVASHAVDVRVLSDEYGDDFVEMLRQNFQILQFPRYLTTIVWIS